MIEKNIFSTHKISCYRCLRKYSTEGFYKTCNECNIFMCTECYLSNKGEHYVKWMEHLKCRIQIDLV